MSWQVQDQPCKCQCSLLLPEGGHGAVGRWRVEPGLFYCDLWFFRCSWGSWVLPGHSLSQFPWRITRTTSIPMVNSLALHLNSSVKLCDLNSLENKGSFYKALLVVLQTKFSALSKRHNFNRIRTNMTAIRNKTKVISADLLVFILI